MSASQVTARMVRMWAIIERMQSRARGVTVPQLEEALGVSRPTVYRDLKILVDSPLPIRKDLVNGEARYRLDATAFSLPKPSSRQVLAMALARRLLGALEGTKVLQEIDAFLALAGAAIPLPVATAEVVAAHTPQHARVLERAIDERCRARLRYPGANGRAGERTVEPVELRLFAGYLYVLAWDMAKKDMRTFKVVRIESVELLAEAADAHPPYDADAVFAHSLGIWTGEATEVRVRISREKARFAAEC